METGRSKSSDFEVDVMATDSTMTWEERTGTQQICERLEVENTRWMFARYIMFIGAGKERV